MSEQKLRESIRAVIKNLVLAKTKEQKRLREHVESLVLEELAVNLSGENPLNTSGGQSEQELFEVVKPWIVQTLKSIVGTLKSRQENAPKSVQIGHTKAVLYALNNLFDEIEASFGYMPKENQLNESLGFSLSEEEDRDSNPYYMSLDAIENDGNEPQKEIDNDSEAASKDKDASSIAAEVPDDLTTIKSIIHREAADPNEAAYEVLGANMALHPKDGSWKSVKEQIRNKASEILNAFQVEDGNGNQTMSELPPVWVVFKKWIFENLKIHLLDTTEQSAS